MGVSYWGIRVNKSVSLVTRLQTRHGNRLAVLRPTVRAVFLESELPRECSHLRIFAAWRRSNRHPFHHGPFPIAVLLRRS